MALLRAMTTVAGMTALSRVAGFARDIMTAAVLGAGPVADAFFVALKLPNFFRRVTAEGAFSVSFVPLYSSTLDQEGQESANRFANNAFWIMSAILAAFSAIAILFMPYVIMAIAPGFGNDPVRYDLGVEFSRITFPYLLLMSLTALLGGVLNAHERFAPFAFAPVFFNLCMIGALLLSNWFETPGHALSYGILVSGFLQLFLLLFIAVRVKAFRLSFKKPEFTDKIKKVFILMGPGVLGAGVMHINLFADLIIASFLPEGSISYLYYADRLNQLPLGVVGIAIGTALLPLLSKAMSRGDTVEAHNLFNRSLEYCLVLALPAAAAMMVIPELLIGTLFERGAFTAADTSVTAMVLMGYALGLPPYIMTKVFSSLHWSRQDTMTPVKIAIACTVFNIVMALILMNWLGVAGIAFATGLAGWMQLGLHMLVLRKVKIVEFDPRFKRNGRLIVLGTALMAGAVFVLAVILPPYMPHRMVTLGICVMAGCALYGAFVWFSGVVYFSSLKNLRRKAKASS